MAMLLVGVGLATGRWALADAAPPGLDVTKVVEEHVAGGAWSKSLAADWLPDGRMLVLTQTGQVHLVNPATGASSLHFTIDNVEDSLESGALDLTVDPNAATNGHFYVYYSLQSVPHRLRIARYTFNANGQTTKNSQTTMWEDPGPGDHTTIANAGVHIGGALDIGPDGKFYLSIGDAYANPTSSTHPSQDLTKVFGKVLRINPDGSAPTDNPFYDGAGPNADVVWAYGLRNPYRGGWDRVRTPSQPTGTVPANGLYWTGDVGGNVDDSAYEEVNIVEPGKNYGWARCEGPLGPPKQGANCPSGVTAPVHYYGHDVNGGCCFNRAIVGGGIYHGSNFPLEGVYLYADYPTQEVSWVQLGADGRTKVDSGLLKKLSADIPVWLEPGPDGYIYFLKLGFNNDGALRRLRYTGAVAQPPTITRASATPTSGPAPLTVQFDGLATDANNDAISYRWDFGDGQSSTSRTVSHTYPTAGAYRAQLRVTAGGDTVTSSPITISVGNRPTASITSPAEGATFVAGQTIRVTGGATDAEDGALSGASLSWTVLFRHNDHFHPDLTGTGAFVDIAAPVSGHDFSGTTGYQVTLRATDSTGLTDEKVLNLLAAKVAIPVSGAASGEVDGRSQPFPFTIDTIPGFRHTVSVPESECRSGRRYAFASWSDGGARSHTIVAAAGLSLRASYTDTGQACSTIGELKASAAPNRSAPEPLNGKTFPTSAGGQHVFLDAPRSDYASVQFWLDSPTTAAPLHTETLAPYDFAGGGVEAANPFDLGTLSAGSHTITARAAAVDGTSATTSATFTVGSAPPPDTTPPTAPGGVAVSQVTATGATVSWTASSDDRGPVVYDVLLGSTVARSGVTTTSAVLTGLSPSTSYGVTVRARDGAGNAATSSPVVTFQTLAAPPPPAGGDPIKVSSSSTRRPEADLHGATLPANGERYIFLAHSESYVRVMFYLGDPNRTGPALRTEGLAPYDFAGGDVGFANPLELATLDAGSHTITAAALRADGTTAVSHATFTK